MTHTEKVKQSLREAAQKKFPGQKITPCEPEFTEDFDMIFYWFHTEDDSTRMIHTHLIDSGILMCEKQKSL